jgi:hypothetical protein
MQSTHVQTTLARCHAHQGAVNTADLAGTRHAQRNGRCCPERVTACERQRPLEMSADSRLDPRPYPGPASIHRLLSPASHLQMDSFRRSTAMTARDG